MAYQTYDEYMRAWMPSRSAPDIYDHFREYDSLRAMILALDDRLRALEAATKILREQMDRVIPTVGTLQAYNDITPEHVEYLTSLLRR